MYYSDNTVDLEKKKQSCYVDSIDSLRLTVSSNSFLSQRASAIATLPSEPCEHKKLCAHVRNYRCEVNNGLNKKIRLMLTICSHSHHTVDLDKNMPALIPGGK